jgi:hypothetical protein
MEARYAKDRQEYKLDVMRPPVSRVWEDAWAVTEHALAALARDVARDGGRLVLVSVPLAQQLVAGEWRDLQPYPYADAWPEDADPAYPAHRLREISARIGATEIDLVPALRAWVARHLEPDPALRRIGVHFRCDGHPSPLGHLLLASALARELVERGLVAPRDGDAARVRRLAGETLAAGPRALLGERAYAQLYGGGVLDGPTAVSQRRAAWRGAR